MADIPPYNIIIVEADDRSVEDVIDSYMDLFDNPEQTEQQIRVALQMFADELSILIATTLTKMQISKHCEILQQLKEEQFNKR